MAPLEKCPRAAATQDFQRWAAAPQAHAPVTWNGEHENWF